MGCVKSWKCIVIRRFTRQMYIYESCAQCIVARGKLEVREVVEGSDGLPIMLLPLCACEAHSSGTRVLQSVLA